MRLREGTTLRLRSGQARAVKSFLIGIGTAGSRALPTFLNRTSNPFSSLLVMESEHCLNGADLGNKLKLVTRNRSNHSVQELNRTLQPRSAVERWEAAREQLSGRPRTGDSGHFIALSML